MALNLPKAVACAITFFFFSSVCAESTHYDPETWTLSTDVFTSNHYQSSPYVANGYFGQRLPNEGVGYWVYTNSTGHPLLNSWPLDQDRATFGTITGFYDVQPKLAHAISPGNLKRGGESVISGIPDWAGLTVTDNGKSYHPNVSASSLESYSQSLSIRNGIVHTNVTWKPHEGDENPRYQLNYTILAHRTRLNLGLIRLDISVDRDASFKLTDIIDGAGAVRADFNEKSHEDDHIWTSVKPVGINYVTAYVSSNVQFQGQDSKSAKDSQHDGADYPWVSKNDSTIARTWDWNLQKDNTLTVFKYIGLSSNMAFPETPLAVATNAALQASQTSWSTLISEHTNKWEEVWADADILIPGDEDLQIRTRASLFHLLTSVVPEHNPGKIDSRNPMAEHSVMVGGLSSDSYGGLIFWDSEIWMYPTLLALHPEYSTSINNYRETLLDQAIRNAQFYNFSGALYPWTSGKFGNCTGTGLCTRYQYHLNADIALSHWQYYQQTGDLKWLAERGWRVIKAVADMFAFYVKPKGDTGMYETIDISEPDEFAWGINNGAFSNAAIKQVLGDWAPSAANLLGHAIPANWSKIANNMYIPYNEDDKIIIEFDGMDGNWQIKQASVGLINYPLGYRISEDQARNDVNYYSSVNTVDGPAMTWSIYSISESQLETRGCASYTYLQSSSAEYIRKPFYQFSEVMSDTIPEGVDNPAFIFGFQPAFPFLTGAGGFLQTITHGMTGFRTSKDGIYLDPVLPPQLSDGITIKGLKWQGVVLDITIGQDETIVTRKSPSASALLLIPNAPPEEVLIRIPLDRDTRGNVEERHMRIGDQISIPTRRPGISSSPLDTALCRPVSCHDEHAPGQFPFAIVDGSNSTVWQPANPQAASAIIDLGSSIRLEKVHINWAAAPPKSFSLVGSNDLSEYVTLYSGVVDISSPWDPETAKLVRLRVGNMTDVELSKKPTVRYLKITVEGSHVPDGLGGTVAEVNVVSEHGNGGDLFGVPVGAIAEKVLENVKKPLFTGGGKMMQYVMGEGGGVGGGLPISP